ncbi:putative allantoate permease of the major facilitator superfamily [Colletotrichum karsti]|uniref:Allantoate permease of the major facilitator superfamily n=1 Tax=Colletotrichum karsti TaxID=1095194 RepID=A0A9P6II27_9PEZI|nr:putative allantoate permease of the major facilitator superfamily [Colletotrichum karsti]KAF9881421.1 putative allantoate permease of the major facilitator superfamily [Colletotrichum karsti]
MGATTVTSNLQASDTESARSGKIISESAADETLRLVEEYGDKVPPLAEQGEKASRRKIQLHVVTLVFIINLLLFIDKATLAYSSYLGIFDETHIGGTEYNNLNTIFYAGKIQKRYIVAQGPGHYLMQKLPLGKFVSVSIFLWSIIIFLHCTAKSYAALIPLRFLLGFFESVLVPSMEVTMGMFLTPKEMIRVQPLFWISCMAAPVPAGFIAYGLLHTHHPTILPWKFFMIITGSLTFLTAIWAWFWYPNNPAHARFLSLEEKVNAIRRIHQVTKSSIEQKTFKKSQLKEAIRDPVTWLFFMASLCLMMANNLAYQQNLIFLKMGQRSFSISSRTEARIGGAFWCLPAVAGGIGMVSLSWESRIPLLACMLLAANTFGITYIIALGWTSATAGGYTKKLVRNVVWMAGYSISNLVSPQIWVAKDAPRYYGAWIAQIVVSWIGTPICLLAIHWILSRRNEERKIWIASQEAQGRRPVGLVEQIDDNGDVTQVEVDISLLDLTDLENKYFIYQL